MKSKKKNKISYGFEKGSDVRATNILINEKGSFFDINIKKTNLLRKETIKKKTKLVNEIISASNKSKFDKMETLLKVILKLGTCELFYFKDIQHFQIY